MDSKQGRIEFVSDIKAIAQNFEDSKHPIVTDDNGATCFFPDQTTRKGMTVGMHHKIQMCTWEHHGETFLTECNKTMEGCNWTKKDKHCNMSANSLQHVLS